MKIAILADIHGNSWALKAVLEDIKSKGISEIYDLGDSLYGPLDPKGTFELILKSNIKSVSGNEDRIIVENLSGNSQNKTLDYVLDEIGQEGIQWIKSLPFSRNINDRIYMCHGTPGSDTEYLIETINPGYVGVKNSLELDRILANIQEPIILCGHSHCSRVVESENKIIINPGSVGLPAYDDDLPLPHKMENFSTRAKYCILELDKKIKIEQLFISYDFEQAAAIADQNGRQDWGRWIRIGRV